MKVVRLSALCTGHPSPQKMSLVLISLRGWVDLGHSVEGRITSMNHSSGTIGGRTHDLLVCSTVPEPTAPLCAAFKYSKIQILWAGTGRRQSTFCLVVVKTSHFSLHFFFTQLACILRNCLQWSLVFVNCFNDGYNVSPTQVVKQSVNILICSLPFPSSSVLPSPPLL